MIKNLKISDDFYLIEKELIDNSNLTKAIVPVSTNFIFCIDVSGSMSYDLKFVRKQLSNKLPSLIKDGDTLTLIWFSGKNQSGILKEEIEVKSLTTLQDLNNLIDRFLQPIGLTAFTKPLELTKQVIDRIKINRPNTVFSLIFLSDGGNNDDSWINVQKAMIELRDHVNSTTIVEYREYADSNRLTEMAETLGGDKILAEDFDEYEVILSNKLSKVNVDSKKIKLKLEGDLKFKFAFTITDDNEIIYFSVDEQNEILINSNLKNVYYFSTDELTDNRFDGMMLINGYDIDYTVKKSPLAKLLYASIYALTDKLHNLEVELLYKHLGDVYSYDIFVNSFGKQKLNNFKSIIRECFLDESKRFLKGYSNNLVLDENAYCVLDLINDLSSSSDNLFYPHHEDFNYNRIGRKKQLKSVDNTISDDVMVKLSEFTDLVELKKYVDSLSVEEKVEDLKFEYYDKNKGYKVQDLVWNETKANLSVTVKYEGYIILPKNDFGIEKVDTFIFRAYTIIKNGSLNLTKLPMSLNQETFIKLLGLGLIKSDIDVDYDIWSENKIVTIDFNSLPIINRSMVKDISAIELGKLEWELLKLQGDKKVYDYYEKLLFPRVSVGFKELYGEEGENYLKSLGITSFNGYAPKTELAESVDFYIGVTFETKISGYSSLPKVIDVENKLKTDINAKLKPSEELLKPAILDYFDQINSKIYLAQDKESQDKILKVWLSDIKTQSVLNKRKIMQEIAKIKFGLILGKKWMTEFNSLDENELDIDCDGKMVKFKFVLGEEEIKI
jgi:hypothetical protein